MSLSLDQISIRQVRGVSALKEGELHAFGIFTVKDLLEYYPFRYEDYRLRSLSEVKDGEKITIQAKIMGVPVLQRYGRKSRLTCKMMAEQWMFTATWFNRHFLRDQLVGGREIVLVGKWDQRRMQLTVSESEFPDQGGWRSGTLQPVYSVGGKITQTWMRKTMGQALTQYGEMIPEILPHNIMQKYRFMPRKQAVATIHQPQDSREGQRGRERMVYEELFLFQLKMQAFRALNRRRMDGIVHTVDNKTMREFVRSLPFELTDAQKKRGTGNFAGYAIALLHEPSASRRCWIRQNGGRGDCIICGCPFRFSGGADGSYRNFGRTAYAFTAADV